MKALTKVITILTLGLGMAVVWALFAYYNTPPKGFDILVFVWLVGVLVTVYLNKKYG